MEFNGKYAIVTGAASGMGRIYTMRLMEMGYGVVAVDINRAGLESLGHGRLVPVCLDLSLSTAAEELKERVKDLEIEILVNNAGMLFISGIVDTPEKKLGTMMSLHCSTPLMLCRAFVPGMISRGRGYVLNISSICAWMDWPLIGMYGNTKRFVKGYSRSLRVETRGTGVSVTTAFFGAVDTPLFGFPERLRKLMLATGVMITPEKAVGKALTAMFRRRKKCMPGILNRLAIPFARLIPDRTLAYLVSRFGGRLSR